MKRFPLIFGVVFVLSGLFYNRVEAQILIDDDLENFVDQFDPVTAVPTKLDTTYWSYKKTVEFSTTLHSVSNWYQRQYWYFQFLTYGDFWADYTREYIRWTNNVQFRLGLRWDDPEGLKEGSKEMIAYKNELKFETAFGYKLFRRFDFAVNGKLTTQIAPAYTKRTDSEAGSVFMAPGYVDIGVGITYKYKKNNWERLDVALFPINSNMILVLDQRLADLGTAGVSPAEYDPNDKKVLIRHGEKTKITWGVRTQFDVKYNFQKPKITIENNFALFVDYLNNPGEKQFDDKLKIVYRLNKVLEVGTQAQFRFYNNEKNIVAGVDADGKDIFKAGLQFMNDLSLIVSFKF